MVVTVCQNDKADETEHIYVFLLFMCDIHNQREENKLKKVVT